MRTFRSLDIAPICLAVATLVASLPTVGCSSASPESGSGGSGGEPSSSDGGGKPSPPTPPPTPPPAPEPAPSGTKTCAAASECSDGLFCEHSSLGATGVCVTGCSTNADCGSGSMCVDGTSVGFDPSCLQTCSSGGDCAGGMDCADIGGGGKVCLPTDWLQAPPPPQKGIGDSCGADTECASGWCVGWCTEYCSSSNSLCEGDYGGKNEFGSFNWCIQNQNNDYVCFPGCTGSTSVCYNFSGTSCQPTYDVDGFGTNICSG